MRSSATVPHYFSVLARRVVQHAWGVLKCAPGACNFTCFGCVTRLTPRNLGARLGRAIAIVSTSLQLRSRGIPPANDCLSAVCVQLRAHPATSVASRFCVLFVKRGIFASYGLRYGKTGHPTNVANQICEPSYWWARYKFNRIRWRWFAGCSHFPIGRPYHWRLGRRLCISERFANRICLQLCLNGVKHPNRDDRRQTHVALTIAQASRGLIFMSMRSRVAADSVRSAGGAHCRALWGGGPAGHGFLPGGHPPPRAILGRPPHG